MLSESGEMRAIKEVTLFSDDAKSKECAKQLGQVKVVIVLCRLLFNLQFDDYHFLVVAGGFLVLSTCFHAGNCPSKSIEASQHCAISWI